MDPRKIAEYEEQLAEEQFVEYMLWKEEQERIANEMIEKGLVEV